MLEGCFTLRSWLNVVIGLEPSEHRVGRSATISAGPVFGCLSARQRPAQVPAGPAWAKMDSDSKLCWLDEMVTAASSGGLTQFAPCLKRSQPPNEVTGCLGRQRSCSCV
jgi:hypothetical protein